MATAKQIAANQRRTVRAIITKIEKMACDFGDVDNWMVEKAEEFRTSAEAYLSELDEVVKGELDD